MWEIAIKRGLGKLEAPSNLLAQMEDQNFVALPLSALDAWVAGHLDRRHTDPFDRALIAQALGRDLRLVTRDSRIGMYGVDILAT